MKWLHAGLILKSQGDMKEPPTEEIDPHCEASQYFYLKKYKDALLCEPHGMVLLSLYLSHNSGIQKWAARIFSSRGANLPSQTKGSFTTCHEITSFENR